MASDDKEWGEVDPKYLTMTIFPEDTIAEAIKIFDIGTIEQIYNNGIEVYFIHHYQIKILKERAKSYADVAISYWHKNHVLSIEAQTILSDGRKIELDNDNIFDEEAKDVYRVKKFSMPNVEVGSILEVKYTIKSTQVHELQPWVFHNEIPVLESEINIVKHPFFSYLVKRTNDPNGLIKQTEDQYYSRYKRDFSQRIRYKATNLPAIRNEPYISTLDNYKARLDFQIESVRTPTYYYEYIKDSQTLSNTLLKEEFDEFMEPEDEVRELVDNLNLEKSTEDQKAKLIYDYVRDNFEKENYNSGIYARKDPEEILEKKKVTDSERNLLLMSMLKAAGFDVKPILISTRGHGYVNPQIPFLRQYNLTILLVNINDNYFMFDARNPWTPYGQLPPSSLVNLAMLVDKDNNQFLEIPNPGLRSYEIVESHINVLPDGKLNGSSEMLAIGYASNNRNKQLYEHKKVEDVISNELSNHLDGYKVTLSDTTLKAVPSDTFNTKFQFTLEDFTEIIEDEIYLRPSLYFSKNKNIFSTEKRVYPVEINYRSQSIESNYFTLPAGFSIAEIPEEITIENKYFKYHRITLIVEKNPLKIGFSRQYEIKELVVPQEDYAKFRSDYVKIIDADQEIIVFKSN